MKGNKSRKGLAIVSALVIVALLGVSIVYVVSSNRKGLELKRDGIVTVGRGDLHYVFECSATVRSGRQGSFDILDGTRVKQVHVRVGDSVKEGDLLATFDAASLDSMLSQKKKDYENAKKTYSDYKANAASAPGQAAALRQRITDLEKRIEELKAAEALEPAQPAAASASENTQLNDIKLAVSGLLGNTRLGNALVDRVFAESGSVAQTISAFQRLLGGSLLGGFSMDSAALSSMMGGMGGLSSESMSLSLELVQLKVQESMSGLSSAVNMDSVYKSLADNSESAYLQAQRTVELLKKGWTAEADGIIRELNIAAGQVYEAPEQSGTGGGSLDMTALLASLTTGNADIGSMLSGLFEPAVKGMVVEYYPFIASFPLGKYDLAKIALDQKVTVTSISGQEFEAVVSFISPVATEGSSINLSSIMGSGGSSKSVECRITIPEPDKSITIGLDVEVSVELENRENVVRVPIESVQIGEDGKSYFVFLYEELSRTLRKQTITTGLFDNSYYEVLEGLSGGETIVRAPQRTMKEGDRVRVAA
ncbi:MAG: biotin/lipoyl-binding protein [Oscillospiraceae bacterium]|nr:biotin/lipoyl-binding protein [Oscillospiraceae bacterium]